MELFSAMLPPTRAIYKSLPSQNFIYVLTAPREATAGDLVKTSREYFLIFRISAGDGGGGRVTV